MVRALIFRNGAPPRTPSKQTTTTVDPPQLPTHLTLILLRCLSQPRSFNYSRRKLHSICLLKTGGGVYYNYSIVSRLLSLHTIIHNCLAGKKQARDKSGGWGGVMRCDASNDDALLSFKFPKAECKAGQNHFPSSWQ